MLASGPTPAEQGIRRCREVFDAGRGRPEGRCPARCSRRPTSRRASGASTRRASCSRAPGPCSRRSRCRCGRPGPLAQEAGWIELLAGDPAAAEGELRRGYDTLDAIGEVVVALDRRGHPRRGGVRQGRYDEARRFTRISEELAGAGGRLLPHALAQRAREGPRPAGRDRGGDRGSPPRRRGFAEATDFLHLRWHDLMCRAETFRLAGRAADADAAAEEAVRVADREGQRGRRAARPRGARAPAGHRGGAQGVGGLPALRPWKDRGSAGRRAAPRAAAR